MLKVTLSEKGQVCIPAAVRERYGLKKGDRLIVEEAEGAIVLRPVPRHPFLSLRGKCKSRQGVSLTSLLLNERALDRKRER